MRRILLLYVVVACASLAGCGRPDQTQAKNVILFLADGGGISHVNSASIHGYGEPLALYVQNMPHIGLSDTSTASSWVSDSAAGMTAIVTGQKTHNGVVSQGPDAIRGEKDGTPLKTILEYAEERGLSTGVVSDSPMSDATPAACYAQVNSRAMYGEIFLQIMKPRFGDGVDVVIGAGRELILERTAALGVDIAEELPSHGYVFLDSLEAVSELGPDVHRVVALFDGPFDLTEAAEHAIRILSRNPNGFFLMVESNTHGGNVRRNLDRMVALDRLIRRTAEQLRHNTLLLFTADHSHDQRLTTGIHGDDIVELTRVDGGTHTAEEVLVAAEGPGGERVKGYMPNTRLFEIMMAAYGWE